MKWREGDTGRWAYGKKFTGRKAGVRAEVLEEVQQVKRLGTFYFLLYHGDKVYNSIWHAPHFASADEAKAEAERAIDEGYPK